MAVHDKLEKRKELKNCYAVQTTAAMWPVWCTNHISGLGSETLRFKSPLYQGSSFGDLGQVTLSQPSPTLQVCCKNTTDERDIIVSHFGFHWGRKHLSITKSLKSRDYLKTADP